MELKTWLKKNNLDYRSFAPIMKCSEMAVWYWENGQRLPSHKLMTRLSKATGGEVTAIDMHKTRAKLHKPT